MKRQTRQEIIIYAAMWVVLFLAPAVMLYHQAVNSQTAFQWHELWHVWREIAMFLVVFAVHNFLLAPMLVYRHQRLRYFSFVAVLLLVFATVQCISRPPIEGGRPPMHEMDDHRQPMPDERFAPHEDMRPPHEFSGKPHMGPGPGPTIMLGQHDVMAIIMFVLMLGMNIGIKLYFRQKDGEQRLAELERKSLEQQLEYLKFQLNPHFLMNTLNNIHALVDIEPEQAKESIVELSKIMRYVLYEGAKNMVPLNREIDFLENYIELMRIRVADHVKISLELPERMPDCELPPLLFITFVENAFKHGVSYRQASFIDISIQAENGQLVFKCRNSKVPQSEDVHGGVGLQNVRQRLELIYPGRHTLETHDGEDVYEVELTLPLSL